jgi:hypothetical protein
MRWVPGLCLTAVCALILACSTRKEPSPRAVQRDAAVGSENASATVSAPAATAPRIVPPPAALPRSALVELGRSVDQKRLERDVQAVAVPRVPKSPGWRRVQQLIEKRLTALGFELERQDYGTGTNLIGTLRGSSSEQVIASAHYDHIERCAGADDNASGVAAALELSRLLVKSPRSRTLRVAFWDEEERGLLGSRAFAQRARQRNEPIVFAVSFDAIGFSSEAAHSQRVPPGFEQLLPNQAAWLAQRNFRGDFIALVASSSAHESAARFATYAEPLQLALLRVEVSPFEATLMPDLFRSDHASFWLSGYPALLLTDTAELRNPAYHCGGAADRPTTLDYGFLARVTGTAVAALADALQPEATQASAQP